MGGAERLDLVVVLAGRQVEVAVVGQEVGTQVHFDEAHFDPFEFIFRSVLDHDMLGDVDVFLLGRILDDDDHLLADDNLGGVRGHGLFVWLGEGGCVADAEGQEAGKQGLVSEF